MLGALCQHKIKTHLCNHFAYSIRIDQLGISESSRGLAEMLFNLFLLYLNLLYKFFFAFQGSECVRMRLSNEFYISGSGKRFKAIKHIRSILFKLVDCSSRYREANLKGRPKLIYQIEQYLVHGDVAFISHPPHDKTVLLLIIILMIGTNIEKTVGFQPIGLMYLEIKTN